MVKTLPKGVSECRQGSGCHDLGGGRANKQVAQSSLKTGEQAAELLQDLEHIISIISRQNKAKPQRNRWYHLLSHIWTRF